MFTNNSQFIHKIRISISNDLHITTNSIIKNEIISKQTPNSRVGLANIPTEKRTRFYGVAIAVLGTPLSHGAQNGCCSSEMKPYRGSDCCSQNEVCSARNSLIFGQGCGSSGEGRWLSSATVSSHQCRESGSLSPVVISRAWNSPDFFSRRKLKLWSSKTQALWPRVLVSAARMELVGELLVARSKSRWPRPARENAGSRNFARDFEKLGEIKGFASVNHSFSLNIERNRSSMVAEGGGLIAERKGRFVRRRRPVLSEIRLK
ncbi:WWE protein-protein interaction domain protein family [Striga asiatica]|uniref:WWE protein-protein interaction domain protein family n=1 Tax=Striga asiatica TaxID=4170 RepID=A0A5A7P811_STRAF|nr:WWE protein-protein interaction domain protein family [Striga asiatica]